METKIIWEILGIMLYVVMIFRIATSNNTSRLSWFFEIACCSGFIVYLLHHGVWIAVIANILTVFICFHKILNLTN